VKKEEVNIMNKHTLWKS